MSIYLRDIDHRLNDDEKAAIIQHTQQFSGSDMVRAHAQLQYMHARARDANAVAMSQELLVRDAVMFAVREATRDPNCSPNSLRPVSLLDFEMALSPTTGAQ